MYRLALFIELWKLKVIALFKINNLLPKSKLWHQESKKPWRITEVRGLRAWNRAGLFSDKVHCKI